MISLAALTCVQIDKHGGSIPCLAPSPDGVGAVSESALIAANALPPTEVDEGSIKASASLFGAIAKFLKNTDPSTDDALRDGVYGALENLESRLAELGTPYLSGKDEPGLADCSVATKLYVLTVAGEHYKNFAIPVDKFPLVSRYVDTSFRCVLMKPSS